MTPPAQIDSRSFPFTFDIATDVTVSGVVSLLEYQDSGLSELPGMIETQFRIDTYPAMPFPGYVLESVLLNVIEDRNPARVAHKAGLKDFAGPPVFKSSPRIHISLERPDKGTLLMRVEWRLMFRHTGTASDKLVKLAGKWDVIDVQASTMTVTVSDVRYCSRYPDLGASNEPTGGLPHH